MSTAAAINTKPTPTAISTCAIGSKRLNGLSSWKPFPAPIGI